MNIKKKLKMIQNKKKVKKKKIKLRKNDMEVIIT